MSAQPSPRGPARENPGPERCLGSGDVGLMLPPLGYGLPVAGVPGYYVAPGGLQPIASGDEIRVQLMGRSASGYPYYGSGTMTAP